MFLSQPRSQRPLNLKWPTYTLCGFPARLCKWNQLPMCPSYWKNIRGWHGRGNTHNVPWLPEYTLHRRPRPLVPSIRQVPMSFYTLTFTRRPTGRSTFNIECMINWITCTCRRVHKAIPRVCIYVQCFIFQYGETCVLFPLKWDWSKQTDS